MRRHLNTLFVSTQGAWLNKDGANVVVSADNTELGRIPIHNLGGIVGFGRVMVSPPLMGYCAESQVGVAFMTEEGHFLARVVGAQSGNVHLRREQYRRTDDEAGAAAIARSIVLAKILNQRTVLRRALRDHGPQTDIEGAADKLTSIARRVEHAVTIDVARGFEGEAANHYFSVFDRLIVGDREVFGFNGRTRRPPLDRVNALLSFTYAILANDVRSALETTGLDPAVGFLHRDRPGRASLALDIMEEFRPYFADRLVLSLINRKQLNASDFKSFDNGAVFLTEDGRKTVLVAYQERKREELEHPFLEEKVTIGLLWHLQAQFLARHLRGDLDGYPPFLAK